MKRPLVASLAMAAAALALVGAVSTSSDPAPGPLTDASVVATVAQTATFSQALRDLLRRARPDDAPREARLAAARGLIDEGRAAGDSRIVGAALGVLGPLLAPEHAEPDALVLAATARQYQHDFKGALAHLDQALRRDPRHLEARLLRATLATVQGRFAEAAPDCRALGASGRPDLGFVCEATLRVLGRDAPATAQRLEQVLARPDLLDPALRATVLGLLGEMSVARGDASAAAGHFRAALAVDPGGLRLRLQLADALVAAGQPEQVLPLLAGQPDADGVLLRRALAAKATGDAPALALARAELDRRFAQNLELGLSAHAREEAMFHLHVTGQTGLALDRALVNWALQREYEDALVLVQAARAAGRPDAARPVADWIAAERLAIPSLGLPVQGAP